MKLEEDAMGSAKPEDAINIIAAGLIKYSIQLIVEKSVSKLFVLSQKTEVHWSGEVAFSSKLEGKGDLDLSCWLLKC